MVATFDGNCVAGLCGPLHPASGDRVGGVHSKNTAHGTHQPNGPRRPLLLRNKYIVAVSKNWPAMRAPQQWIDCNSRLQLCWPLSAGTATPGVHVPTALHHQRVGPTCATCGWPMLETLMKVYSTLLVNSNTWYISRSVHHPSTLTSRRAFSHCTQAARGRTGRPTAALARRCSTKAAAVHGGWGVRQRHS
jgi:hypothetical protein